jgi:hypothetical protein
MSAVRIIDEQDDYAEALAYAREQMATAASDTAQREGPTKARASMGLSPLTKSSNEGE